MRIRLKWKEKELDIVRFGGEKSAAMYNRNEKYIMLGFYVEKMCHWYLNAAMPVILPVSPIDSITSQYIYSLRNHQIYLKIKN